MPMIMKRRCNRTMCWFPITTNETPIEDAPKKQDQPTTTADEEAERKRREKLRREQERKQEQTASMVK